MKLAVIETGGKQYLVSEGKKIKIEKIEGEEGAKIKFDRVLLIGDENKVEIGDPYLKGKHIEAELAKTGRTRKVVVFHYHSKTRYRKKNTHRQYFTEAKVTKI
jgi:large subunit ribosomal protein L21